MCRRAGASGEACRSTSTCGSPRGAARDAAWTVERIYADLPAPRRTPRQWRRAAFRRRAADARDLSRAPRQPAVSWSWTSRPRAWRRSSSSRSRRCSSRLADEGEIAVLLIEQNIGVAAAVAEQRRASWSTGASTRSCRRASLPPTATCSSACSASAGMATSRSRTPVQAEPRRQQRASPRSFSVVRGEGEPPSPDGRARRASAPSTSLPNRWSLPTSELGRGVRRRRRPTAPGGEAAPTTCPRDLFGFRSPSGTAARRSSSAPSTPRVAS